MKSLQTRCRTKFLFLMGIAVIFRTAVADISVPDDTGKPLILDSPARRIVSLAPNVTELLYAAGAGNAIVGTVEYSDYPEAAKNLPRVGSGVGLDIETIVALRPDLIIAWRSGNPVWQIQRLIQLGYPVFMTEAHHMSDVAGLLEKIGRLTGTERIAGVTADAFRRHEARLRARYAGRPTVTVFYQILDNALLTINRRHLISGVIQLCGGRNVFADRSGLVPRVDIESVVDANPKVILAGGFDTLWTDWHRKWLAWPRIDAVANGDLYFIPPDLIHRHGPRILKGAERVCAVLDQARASRAKKTRH